MILQAMCGDYGIVPIIKSIKSVFLFIEIIVPIIAIISLTKIFFDGIKSSDDKINDKTKNKIKNIFISLTVIFLLPMFVSVIMNLNVMKTNFNVASCWDEADNVQLSSESKYIDIYDNERQSIISNPDNYEEGIERPTEDNINDNSQSSSGNNSRKSNDKAGNAGLSSKGKVSYLTKNGKNWNLNSHVDYNLNQSACTDGNYLYVAFKRDDNHGLIAKFDINSRKLIKKSKIMDLGHANDMTYDYSRGKLLVTREQTNDLSLSMIDPNTFSKQTVKVTIPKNVSGASRANLNAIKAFNGICYDNNRGQLLIRARYGNSQLIWVDNNFRAVKALTIRKWFNTDSQGMECINNKVIYSQSILQYRSSVTSYNKKSGNKIKSTQLGVHGELEGVFYYNGDLYGVTFDKSSSGNKSLIYKIDSSKY